MRSIFCSCLAVLFGLQGVDLYAQVKDSPQNYVNAIDHRYQYFDGKLPVFADSVKFRDRFYNVFKAGIEGDWEQSLTMDNSLIGFNAGLGFGYRLTPVHAIEADFRYTGISGRHYGGVDLNYVANLNNFATRKDGHNKVETLFIIGASYRQEQKASYGMNTGLRLQWNPGKNAGLFIEPKLHVMSSENPMTKFTSRPSVTFGLTLRYQKPDYYLWDYLTPFAIKSNLLYDAMSALNIGIEVPIRDHWSVAFDWVAPWWSSYDKQVYIQMMLGGIEGRYWFGDRLDTPQLTGWFAGVSLQGGLYDFMFDPIKGIQGEFQAYSAVGGYAHSISRNGNLRMEYSLGLGYMRTEYVKYWWDGFDYTLVAPSPQTWLTNWFGPTKLQVSLVYMLKLRSKVGGRP